MIDIPTGDWKLITGGSFLMGSPAHEYQNNAAEWIEKDRLLHEMEQDNMAPEPERCDNETQHSVRLSDFFMMKYPVTIADFEQFVAETDYQTTAEKSGTSRCWSGSDWVEKQGVNWRQDAEGFLQFDKKHPVVHVSWNDAVAYCNWMSSKSRGIYRLPTEAEWEYACRAGAQTPFNTGRNLPSNLANYDGRYPYPGYPKGIYLCKTTPVGSYPPNIYGLCDMHGNVWEWCNDWYNEDYYSACKLQGEVDNPTGPEQGSSLVLRGGSWNSVAALCRSAYRLSAHPGFRLGNAGFRVVYVPDVL